MPQYQLNKLFELADAFVRKGNYYEHFSESEEYTSISTGEDNKYFKIKYGRVWIIGHQDERVVIERYRSSEENIKLFGIFKRSIVREELIERIALKNYDSDIHYASNRVIKATPPEDKWLLTIEEYILQLNELKVDIEKVRRENPHQGLSVQSASNGHKYSIAHLLSGGLFKD